MEDSKTLLCSSKFPWAHKRIVSKFIDNLGTCPQKGSPALSSAKTSCPILEIKLKCNILMKNIIMHVQDVSVMCEVAERYTLF